MSLAKEATFRVNPYTDPVIVQIMGRPCYTNCSPLRDFFDQQITLGHRHFALDFAQCQSMDSTFLGILTGAAIKLRKAQPPGKMLLCALGSRNLELVTNLGLDQIMEVQSQVCQSLRDLRQSKPIEKANGHSNQDDARMILRAHQDLCEVDDANRNRFQDVIAYLKNEVEKETIKD